jgi:hypothetical protein
VRRLLIVIVLAVMAPAAVAQQPPKQEGDPDITSGAAARNLAAAVDRWRAAKVRSYGYDVRVSCFCAPGGPERVVVRGGRPRKGASEQFGSVPRLHRLVRRKIQERVESLEVDYDKRGVPRRISIDHRRLVADDEITYAVERFKARR